MFAWMTGSSLKFRRLIVPLAIGMIAFGFVQIGSLDRDTLPEFAAPMVEVQTEALGLSAEEVEQLITSPLEQDLLNGVAFLKDIESASLPGLSSVVMTFEDGTDILDARQVVNERLTQAVGAAGLPQVASLPQMLQPLSSTSRVAMVSLSSETQTPIQLSVLARWLVSPRLLGVEGVANVSIWGFRDRQLQVLVDPTELANQDVSMSQVIRTTGNALEVSPLSFLEASTPGTGGFIDTANQRLHVFHEQAITSADELAQVPLEGPDGEAFIRDGRPVPLGDVTEIVEDHQPLIGDAHCAGGPCLLLVVEKFPQSNTPAVSAEIDAALEDLRPALPGVDIDSSIYQPASFLDVSSDNLARVLIVGAVLALLVLALFLFDWRTIAVAAITILTSLSIGAAVLRATETTVNVMIVAGLVLALVSVIDEAITSATLIHQNHHRDPGDGDRFALWRSTMKASLESRRVGLYGLLVVLAGLLPVVFLQGEAGAFLPTVAASYALGAAAGLLAALVVAPALGMVLFEHTGPPRPLGPLGRAIASRYQPMMGRLAQKTTPMAVAAGIAVLAGLLVVPTLDTSMRPELRERDLVVKTQAPPGTSLQTMSATTEDMRASIAEISGVDEVVSHVGRAITSDQVVNVNEAALWISMAANAPYDETLAAIEDSANGFTDVDSQVVTYSDERVTQLLGRPESGLVVRVLGDNSGEIDATAEQISGALLAIDGVESAQIERPIVEDTLEIEVDLDRAQQLGLKPGDVRRTAAILMSGITVGNLFEQQKVFDVVVWGRPELRGTIDDVMALPITTPSGDVVPLSDVADVRVASNPTVIRHESVSPFLDIAVTPQPGFGQDQVAEAIDVALQQSEFSLGLHAELLGGFSEERAARTTVLVLTLAAAVGIFLLLQAAFTSWRLALLALAGIPVTMATGLLAMGIFGRTLSVGGLMGLLVGIGIVVRGAVLLMTRYQESERAGGTFGQDLVVGGTLDRMPAITLTGLITFVVFFPLAIGTGVAGLEIVGPMAVAILGSLIGAMAFVLVALPAFYVRWGRVRDPDTSADDLFAIDLLEPTRVRG